MIIVFDRPSLPYLSTRRGFWRRTRQAFTAKSPSTTIELANAQQADIPEYLCNDVGLAPSVDSSTKADLAMLWRL